MSDATELQPRPAPAQSEGAVILAMIDRLTQMPELPVERLEQVFSLYQRVQADSARKAYAAAFAAMQAELPVVVKKGKSHHGPYGRWEDIVEQIHPVLGRHGFSLSFRTTDAGGKLRVTAILLHQDGHSEENYHDLPTDKSGSKNDIQAIGSSTSYGKRYAAASLLNIVTKGEDDDAVKALTGTVTAAQAEELAKLISATKTDIHRFLEMGEVESLSDIPASQFAAAKAKLLAKQAQMMKGGR